MGDPIYKIAKHKPTGEWVRVRSDDGGSSWAVHERISAEPAAASAPQPAQEPPTPAPVAQQPAPAQVEQPRVQGFGDWFTDQLEKKAEAFQNSAIGSGLAGIGRVLTLGHADELAGVPVGMASVDDGTNIPRVYRSQGPINEQIANVRETQNRQDAEHPLATGVGKGAGAGMLAVAAAPYMAAAAPLEAALGTAALGMAQGSGDSTATTPVGVARDASVGGTVALAGGALPEVVAPVLRYASKPVAAFGDWLSDTATSPAARTITSARNANRAAAAGGYGGNLAALERENPGYVQQLGQFAEDMNLGSRGERTRTGGALTGGIGGALYGAVSSDEDTLLGRIGDAATYGAAGAAGGAALRLPLPSTASVYRDNARGLLAQLDESIGRTLDDVSSYGYGYPKADLKRKLYGLLRELPDPNVEEGQALREVMKRKIDASLDSLPDELDARTLQNLKKQYEGRGGYRENAPRQENDVADAYASLASAPRSMRDQAMREQALPDDEREFFSSISKYGMASDIAAQGTKRAAQEEGNQMLSLPAAATGSIPGSIAAELLKRGGRDMTADALSGVLSAGRSMASLPSRIQSGASAALPSAVGAIESPQARAAAEAAPEAFMPMPAFAQEDDGPTFDQWMAVNGARTPEQSVQFGKRTATDPEFRARLRANAQEK